MKDPERAGKVREKGKDHEEDSHPAAAALPHNAACLHALWRELGFGEDVLRAPGRSRTRGVEQTKSIRGQINGKKKPLKAPKTPTRKASAAGGASELITSTLASRRSAA